MKIHQLPAKVIGILSVVVLSGCVTINEKPSAQPEPSVTTITASASPSSEATPGSGQSPVAETSQASVPQPTAPAPQSAAPEGVAPGTSCGPSNTGASTLVVAENAAGLNCDQVQSIFADFNAAFANGGATHHQIQGFACHTRSPEAVKKEGRSVTCTQGGTRLEAMTVYPLGGIPVADQDTYKATGEKLDTVWFATDFGFCTMTYLFRAIECSDVTSPVRNDLEPLPLRITDTRRMHFLPKGNELRPSGTPAYLPKGHVINLNFSACLNEGHQVTCDNGVFRFTVDSSGVLVL